MTKAQKLRKVKAMLNSATIVRSEMGNFYRCLKKYWEDPRDGYQHVQDIDLLPVSVQSFDNIESINDQVAVMFEDVIGQLRETLKELNS